MLKALNEFEQRARRDPPTGIDPNGGKPPVAYQFIQLGTTDGKGVGCFFRRQEQLADPPRIWGPVPLLALWEGKRLLITQRHGTTHTIAFSIRQSLNNQLRNSDRGST